MLQADDVVRSSDIVKADKKLYFINSKKPAGRRLVIELVLIQEVSECFTLFQQREGKS